MSTERNSAGDEENAATTENLQDDNGDGDMGSAESDGRSKTQDNRNGGSNAVQRLSLTAYVSALAADLSIRTPR